MKQIKPVWGIVLLCMALLLIAPGLATAKGIPTYYTVSGTDTGNGFMFTLESDEYRGLLFDPLVEVSPAPEMTTEPYIIRSYFTYEGETSESILSPVHFYPLADGDGIIYYVGARDRGVYQEFDGRWYAVPADIALELQSVIQAARVTKWVKDALAVGILPG
jgi:hypothetical protein